MFCIYGRVDSDKDKVVILDFTAEDKHATFPPNLNVIKFRMHSAFNKIQDGDKHSLVVHAKLHIVVQG